MEIVQLNGSNYRDGIPPGRCTGQTFRCMTQSLALASDGDHVYYIANDENHKRWLIRKFEDILKAYFNERCMYRGQPFEAFEITFPQGGFVKIVTERKWHEMRTVKPGVYENFSIVEIWDHPVS
jgi:hypothetical protein